MTAVPIPNLKGQVVPTDLRIFLLGAAGSLAVEVVNIIRVYEAGKPLSVRYKRPVFLSTRLVMAGIGGMLAWAYHIDNDVLAINIGASAPLIMQAFAKPPQEQ